jgi:hypothetical protein
MTNLDEWRASFERVTAGVVPIEDPYGRLTVRHRRRLRNRIAQVLAVIAAAAAVAVIAPFALQPATPRLDSYPVDSEWTWKNLRAPTRGNLPADFALQVAATFARGREGLGIDPSLTKTKVLFAYGYPQMRQVVVAFYNETRAAVISRAAALPHASAAGLLAAPGGKAVPATPFLVIYSGIDGATGAVVGLAPEGCEISSSVNAEVAADGAWHRSFQPGEAATYDVGISTQAAKLWQVKCDNRIREVRAARPVDEMTGTNYSLSGREGDTWPTASAAASLHAAAAVHHALRFASGLGGDPRLTWMGELPEPAILLAPVHGAGITTLHIGSSNMAMIALEPDNGLPSAGDNARAGWSIASTGYTADADFVVIRVPKRQGGRAVLDNRVLAVAKSAAMAQALDKAGAIVAAVHLTDGAGLLLLPVGGADRVRFLDADGKVLRETGFAEPASGPRLFGDQLTRDWS